MWGTSIGISSREEITRRTVGHKLCGWGRGFLPVAGSMHLFFRRPDQHGICYLYTSPERPSQKTTFVHTVHSGIREFQNLTSSVASEMSQIQRRQIFSFWSMPPSPTCDVCLPTNGKCCFAKARVGRTLKVCWQNRHNEY